MIERSSIKLRHLKNTNSSRFSISPTQVLSVNVSVFTLTAIAFDRYRAVLHPHKGAGASKQTAQLSILLIWLLGALFALPYPLALRVTRVYDPRTKGYTRPFCTNRRVPPKLWAAYHYALAGMQYALPLGLMCFAYGRMALRLKGAGTVVERPARPLRGEEVLKNKKKVCVVVAFLIMLPFVCRYLQSR